MAVGRDVNAGIQRVSIRTATAAAAERFSTLADVAIGLAAGVIGRKQNYGGSHFLWDIDKGASDRLT